MIHIRKVFSVLCLIGLCCCSFSYAEQVYREKLLPQGRAIYGLREAEALNKYGTPTAVKDGLWFYDGAEKLYIYLNKSIEVYLYPRFARGYLGFPLELKTFSGPREIADVTAKSELLLSDPEAFNIVGQGVVVPKKTGQYQIIAIYKDRHSNTSFVSVTEPKKDSLTEEQLVSIDIFPHKPYVNPNNSVYFYAFGTFLFEGNYSVREITRQVDWFSEQNGQILKSEGSKITTLSPGKFKVFCKYQEVQSTPQEGEMARKPEKLTRYLKHLSILPADVAVTTQTSIPFYVFATYGDNSMEDVTKKITWRIKDNAILEREDDHTFLAKLVGVTELQGALGNLRSLAAKVVVSYSPVNKGQEKKAKMQKISPEDMLDDIKSDIKDLNKKVTEEKKIKYIKIVPDFCDITAGAQKQLFAFAVRQDNTEEDITILGRWEVADDNIATVNSGLVTAVSPGETKVCIRYKNLGNKCIPVLVGKAKLVSIMVSPQQFQIAKSGRLSLKAEGYFGDSSHEDMTPLVSWISDDPNIAKMDENNVLAIRVGKAKIFAEYLKVRSLPVEADVVEEKHWLLKFIIKILLSLFLIVSILYTYFYIKTAKVRDHILGLYPDPRDLTIALYKNLTRIIIVFGIQHKFYMPPLFLAKLADEKYAIKDNLFLKFTQRYEEAKYSSHTFPPESSSVILDAYNQILRIIFTQQRKRILVYRHLQALIKGIPFFIHKV
ncbi:MAG: hypothetical protein PHO40_05515 [Candidatus Omnitrophica bacterium]|jgi:hypothetical protein|nr:hypothetical protein [Candidatus Omnitrophota bacterium]